MGQFTNTDESEWTAQELRVSQTTHARNRIWKDREMKTQWNCLVAQRTLQARNYAFLLNKEKGEAWDLESTEIN